MVLYLNEMDRKRVICPHCGYRMPLEYDDTTSVHGLYIKCKGTHCKKNFEIVIKDGVQYKRAWLFEKLTGFFKSVF